MKKLGLVLLNISLLFFLTGCWDRVEINDVAFVVATGVDKGKDHRYSYSVEVPLPSSLGGAGSSGGGGGTSGEGPSYVAQGTGGNSRLGIEDIQLRLSRKLYFGHRRVTIIGEEMAKDGIAEILKAIFIQPQSRLSTFLLISKGPAVNLLKTQPRMEQYAGEALREMAKSNINMTVKDALEDLDRPGKDMVIPFIQQTGTIKKEMNGKEVLMQNFAIFKADKLAFETDFKESLGILWLQKKMWRKSLPFDVGKNEQISVQIIDNGLKTRFKVVNGKPAFQIAIRTTAVLLENKPNLRLEDPKTYHFILSKMEKEIEQEVKNVLDHAHSVGADAFGFGWYLYRNHHQEWEKNWHQNWKQNLKDLNVTVTVDADIQRTTSTGLIEKE